MKVKGSGQTEQNENERFIYNKGEGKIHDVKCRHFTIAICINFSPQQDLGDCSKYLRLSEA